MPARLVWRLCTLHNEPIHKYLYLLQSSDVIFTPSFRLPEVKWKQELPNASLGLVPIVGDNKIIPSLLIWQLGLTWLLKEVPVAS